MTREDIEGRKDIADHEGLEARRFFTVPYLSSRRGRTILLASFAAFVLIMVTILGQVFAEDALVSDFSRKNLPPGFPFLFGTDFLGRDMIKRTFAGLSMSIRLGIITSAASGAIALLLGTASALLGKRADQAVTGIINLVMGIPHILLLILISFACGKGLTGVVIGISLTHWTSLARLLRAEVLQLKESQYVKISEKLGMGRCQIVKQHILPHLLPQFLTGLVLLFPHAILHEASITFLGFGLSPEQPAIGIILSESMKYLITGKWWLAVFPGACLVIVVLLFQGLGQGLNNLLDPGSAHE